MKTITPENYLITPFRANKSWQFNYTYLGANNSSSVSIDVATVLTNPNLFVSGSEGTNPDGIVSRTLYDSVQNLFYTSSNTSLPLGTLDKQFYPSGSQFYVVNISQQTYGEGIRPGTFSLASGFSTASILDDGVGHLYSSVNSRIVGNIIYNSGIAIISQDTGSYSSSVLTDNGLFLPTGSVIDINYAGIHTIYEHKIYCTIEPGEMNFSSNPSVLDQTLSGSFSGSSFIQTSNGPQYIDLISSGSNNPYFTQIGLYDDQHVLMAVAKFPVPLRRSSKSTQTVVISIDL